MPIKTDDSSTEEDSIPSMSRHVRRHKKIPGSVRKPTNKSVLLHINLEGGSGETVFFKYPKYVGEDKPHYGDLVKYTQRDMRR